MKKTTSQHLHVPVSKTGSRNTLHAFLKSTSSLLLRKTGEIINLLESTVVAMETYDLGQQDFPQAYTRSFVMVEEFSLLYESHLTILKFVNSKEDCKLPWICLKQQGRKLMTRQAWSFVLLLWSRPLPFQMPTSLPQATWIFHFGIGSGWRWNPTPPVVDSTSTSDCRKTSLEILHHCIASWRREIASIRRCAKGDMRSTRRCTSTYAEKSSDNFHWSYWSYLNDIFKKMDSLANQAVKHKRS